MVTDEALRLALEPSRTRLRAKTHQFPLCGVSSSRPTGPTQVHGPSRAPPLTAAELCWSRLVLSGLTRKERERSVCHHHIFQKNLAMKNSNNNFDSKRVDQNKIKYSNNLLKWWSLKKRFYRALFITRRLFLMCEMEGIALYC